LSGFALFIKPSFRVESVGVIVIFGVKVIGDTSDNNNSSGSNIKVTELVVFSGLSGEEVGEGSGHSEGFLEDSSHVVHLVEGIHGDLREILEDFVDFLRKFLLGFGAVEMEVTGESDGVTGGIHRSQSEHGEFIDKINFIQMFFSQFLVLLIEDFEQEGELSSGSSVGLSSEDFSELGLGSTIKESSEVVDILNKGLVAGVDASLDDISGEEDGEGGKGFNGGSVDQISDETRDGITFE